MATWPVCIANKRAGRHESAIGGGLPLLSHVVSEVAGIICERHVFTMLLSGGVIGEVGRRVVLSWYFAIGTSCELIQCRSRSGEDL